MKRIILFIIAAICILSCSPSSDYGYGYNATATDPSVQQQEVSRPRKKSWEERWYTYHMRVYSRDIESNSFDVVAMKGEFDGHTWYYFERGDGRNVVHDPLCQCRNN